MSVVETCLAQIRGRGLRVVFFLAARAGFLRRAVVFFEAFGLAFDRRAAAFLARFFAITTPWILPAYSSPCPDVKGKRRKS